MKTLFKQYPGENFDFDSCTIPGQDYSISELLARFSRGERLNVVQRPVNILHDGELDETEDNILPQLDDITELEEYNNYIQEQKKQINEERSKYKKSIENLQETKQEFEEKG